MWIKSYTPVHDDTGLNDDWWHERGFSLTGSASMVHRNLIRDGSGRYRGYIYCNGREVVLMTTVEDANRTMLAHGLPT